MWTVRGEPLLFRSARLVLRAEEKLNMDGQEVGMQLIWPPIITLPDPVCTFAQFNTNVPDKDERKEARRVRSQSARVLI